MCHFLRFRTSLTKRLTVQQIFDQLDTVEQVTCSDPACRAVGPATVVYKVPDNVDLLIISISDLLYNDAGHIVEGCHFPRVYYNGRVVNYRNTRWFATAMATSGNEVSVAQAEDEEAEVERTVTSAATITGHWRCLVPLGRRGFFIVDGGKEPEKLGHASAMEALKGVRVIFLTRLTLVSRQQNKAADSANDRTILWAVG